MDKDLAILYGVGTKAFNQAVKRNIDRFPEDCMFQLRREPIAKLSQICSPSLHGGGQGVGEIAIC